MEWYPFEGFEEEEAVAISSIKWVVSFRHFVREGAAGAAETT